MDKSLWKENGQLHIFSQNVNQADDQGLSVMEPQAVRVIEIDKLPIIK